MVKKLFLLMMLSSLALSATAAPGKARLTEGKTTMQTYGFSDPNPVANPDLLQYPYFRFDGYAVKSEPKEW